MEFSADLEKCKAQIVEKKSIETSIVRRHEELMKALKQLHAEEATVWERTSRENGDSLTNDVKVAKAGIVMTSVQRDMILSRSEDHVRALQILGNANMEPKVTLTDAIANFRELFENR